MPDPIAEIPDFTRVKFLSINQRLELRCRDNDFSSGLEARTADPLWLLARQWQIGEFQAEDAGSPIKVNVEKQSNRVESLKFGKTSEREKDITPNSPPLEAMVEHEYITHDQIKKNWRLRIQVGQHLERILRGADLDDTKQIICQLRESYPVTLPDEEERVELDLSTQQFISVMAGRVIDGGKFLLDIYPDNENNESELPVTLISKLGDSAVPVSNLLPQLVNWFESVHGKISNSEPTAWHPEHLEYSFKVEAHEQEGHKTILEAPSYRNGDLDWYTFSIDEIPDEPDPNQFSENDFIPTRVSFHGMPHPRWWAFEDSQTDFGNLDTAKTDLAKMMIMNFALTYGNDWFMIPLPIEVGAITRIQSLMVTDVFGMETEIQPARSTEEEAWKSWEMFSHSYAENSNRTGDFIFIPPTCSFCEESEPLEEVRFLRDEMANMVWGVEKTVRNGLGQSWDGFEAQTERRARERKATLTEAREQLRTLRDQLQTKLQELDSILENGGTTPEALESDIDSLKQQIEDLQTMLDKASTGSENERGENGHPQYKLATPVPENWIPFVPVRLPDSWEVYLRQAGMLVNEIEEHPSAIEPMTNLLAGDGPNDPKALNKLREEAVTRAGQKYQLAKQRVRWMDGKTYVWTGRKVVAGKGEGSSGLKFDQISND